MCCLSQNKSNLMRNPLEKLLLMLTETHCWLLDVRHDSMFIQRGSSRNSGLHLRTKGRDQGLCSVLKCFMFSAQDLNMFLYLDSTIPRGANMLQLVI